MTEQPAPAVRSRVLRKWITLHHRPGEPERTFRSQVWREGHGPEQRWSLALLEDKLVEEELMGRSRVVVAEWLEEVS